jgi:hypothetical protein
LVYMLSTVHGDASSLHVFRIRGISTVSGHTPRPMLHCAVTYAAFFFSRGSVVVPARPLEKRRTAAFPCPTSYALHPLPTSGALSVGVVESDVTWVASRFGGPADGIVSSPRPACHSLVARALLSSSALLFTCD